MMSLEQAAEKLSGIRYGENIEFNSVSTDTRTLLPGDLYVALHGETFDGHDYIEQARQAGAIAAVLDREVKSSFPYVKVKDTRKALGDLAAAWRQSFRGSVVAITGSNGKTTVKEMLAAILRKQGEVLATKGNFNNDIGLPLTLLRAASEKFAVIEMGANHAGEIAYLVNITKPDIAVITNAGPSHLEGFGSIEGVARAKGEIYHGLTQDGVAVVNVDDDFGAYWLSLCEGRKVLSFSMQDETADVTGSWQAKNTGGALTVQVQNEKFDIDLKVPGMHNAMNALAAITVAEALNVSHKDIVQALNEFEPVKGRLNIHQIQNSFVIDDTYNANPASLMAGINVLNELPGEHWLVLGDMGELGQDDRRLHFDAGLKARRSGVTRLLATGSSSRHAVDAFGESGIFFDNKDELISFIKQHQKEELAILIKGSRFMHMEQIVESLIKGLS